MPRDLACVGEFLFSVDDVLYARLLPGDPPQVEVVLHPYGENLKLVFRDELTVRALREWISTRPRSGWKAEGGTWKL